jgi:hypothetical protein
MRSLQAEKFTEAILEGIRKIGERSAAFLLRDPGDKNEIPTR